MLIKKSFIIFLRELLLYIRLLILKRLKISYITWDILFSNNKIMIKSKIKIKKLNLM